MGDNTMGFILLLVLAAVGFYLYFLPSIIASKAQHRSAGAILALNLLTGWSFIGWVIALVWALNSQPAQVNVMQPVAAAPQGETKPCPFCAEPIRVAAIRCKHCAADLVVHPSNLVG